MPQPLDSSLDRRLAAELEHLRAANLYRTRRVIAGAHGVAVVVEGRACLNFCSNDYLGLAADPRVAEAARAALAQNGTGSGAAALVSGYNREHQALEEELAAYLGRPRALLFSSGWAANLGVLRALLGKSDTLIADELNHASLIDGGRLSGARYERVAHADPAGYAAALQARSLPPGGGGLGRGGARPGESPLSPNPSATASCVALPRASMPSSPARGEGNQVVVATDHVFSMDGDLAPVAALAALCRARAATLVVDDAHGFGVLDFKPALDEVPVYVATLGKALGCAGAFVAGSETLIEYLIQRARSWVFSTAPPPALAAAARAALRIVASAEGDALRAKLRANIRQLREGAAARGIVLGESQTAIQPLLLGEEARALAVSRHLQARGFWVAAIRPPTVPAGTSRLRITLSAAHTPAQIEALLDALAESLALRAAA